MNPHTPQPILLSDYTPPAYTVEQAELRFELAGELTTVDSRLSMRRLGEHSQPLCLDGQELELLELRLDGRPLSADEYRLDENSLTIPEVPAQFVLEVRNRIRPDRNTALEGLYQSGEMLCSQCEAQGFRRITWYPDRPDVMARFRVTLVGERERYPVLLCNGNPVERGELEGGRHWVTWEDPYPKPSYLFALVAGDLQCHRDRYRTGSGREVALELYYEAENAGKTAHALESLKKAMAWDEETYGLEYDLDIYMIVAVGDFNMGAMENKGLNIFNTACVLASAQTATDGDFETVEAVIGHEYFHNWTGNRVTCRDWFQLSLKEGLTVFREQQFSEAMGSPAVQRINQVRLLRAVQFPEDAGPTAHPVRPESYLEINNFYTSTIYNKGGEVIRMYHTLLGAEGFRRGMDLYVQRHDGQAVTCDDFRAAMADANDRDLAQFGRWYSQAGTPRLRVSDHYDPDKQRYTLKVMQSCPATPGQTEKQPFHIPLKLGLLAADGRDLPLRLAGESEARAGSRVLELREREETFVFEDLPERPVPSLLRGFSAPVQLDYPYSLEQLAFLFARDSDPFNRWEAGQRLACRVLLEWARRGPASQLPEELLEGFRRTLADTRLDRALIAEALSLPGEAYLAEQMQPADPGAIHDAREALRRQLGRALRPEWLRLHAALADDTPYRYRAEDAGRRRLRNLALDYLLSEPDADTLALAHRQLEQADNMTAGIAALSLLADQRDEASEQALERFHKRWRHDALVLDKWFRVQATSRREDILKRVAGLARHADFHITNPNRVRALLGAFAQGNPSAFHHPSGGGYRFLADHVLKLNDINPQIAARLVTPLSRWQRFDETRQGLMRAELERIMSHPTLSNDVYELVSKSLNP
ncbi:aminopeptidase N [Alkalilimnicola sp. S0819]|uniref:aminopeptidase N n=1 Tax=Alkalilimnicola sp. S0819 TaxID=2613922 RepID=UPI0012619C37|nr:aminopeptidase N [Alkalilimnicola sp. S0819]KAB7622650.1 aminopeptidase N [Alkalilimnicola sp. S0819]MPQ17421.1 aminopeptidase N [Alkalilimnicola sp. S0819]